MTDISLVSDDSYLDITSKKSKELKKNLDSKFDHEKIISMKTLISVFLYVLLYIYYYFR